MQPDTASLIKYLPPEVAGYVVVAVLMIWISRRGYHDLLKRYEARFDQLETTQANLAQTIAAKEAELAQLKADLRLAQDAETRCHARMERLEARYEKRIAELEHEIAELRGEISEPMAANAP